MGFFDFISSIFGKPKSKIKKSNHREKSGEMNRRLPPKPIRNVDKRKSKTDMDPEGNEGMWPKGDVIWFKLSENNCTSQDYVLEANLGEEASLASYTESCGGCSGDKLMINERRGKELKARLLEIIEKADLLAWNGFNGTDSNWLDGTTMHFNAQLSNGDRISAYGSNSFPKTYWSFVKELRNLLEFERLDNREFTHMGIRLLLPEEWVGVVSVQHSDGHVCFYYEINGNSIYLVALSFSQYGYFHGCGQNDGIKLGEFEYNGKNLFFWIKSYNANFGNYSSQENALTPETRRMCMDAFSGKVLKGIVKSVKAVESD